MIASKRVYRMRTSQRAVGIALLAVGCFFLMAIWGGVLSGLQDATFLKMMFPVVYLIFAAIVTFRGFRNSVFISDQVIELRGLRGTRALPVDKISGRRRYMSRGDEDAPAVWHLVIESNDDRFPKLDIEELYRFDDTFYLWFTSLPDLDELDKTRPKPSNFGLV